MFDLLLVPIAAGLAALGVRAMRRLPRLFDDALDETAADRATIYAVDGGDHITIAWVDQDGTIVRQVGQRTLRDWGGHAVGTTIHESLLPVLHRAVNGETVQYCVHLQFPNTGVSRLYFGIASTWRDGRGAVRGARFDVIIPPNPLDETESVQ